MERVHDASKLKLIVLFPFRLLGTFVETSMPVVEYYRGSNKVYEIPAIGSKDEVYAKVRVAVDEILLK